MTPRVSPPQVSGTALPTESALGLRQRALYRGAVLGDYALRTGLASLVGVAPVGAAARGGWRTERRRLEFYAELAARGDAAAVFAPPERVEVQSRPGRGEGLEGGRVEVLRFASPYVALNPELREAYARHENNAIARAQHWRHEDGPRPTLCVIHGFGASPAWFNAMFFSLKRFFAEGWDVLLYTLPFHGSRRGPRAPVNGLEIFAHGMAHFSEAMIHAVHDFRALLDYLEARGAPRVGVTGLSLGGYTSALLAAVESRLDFVVPNAAVSWMPPLLRSWFPANLSSGLLFRVSRVDDDLLTQALAVHSSLTYPAALPKERLMIVAGLGDRLAPPEQSELLWEHWDRPALHWFPGSHILHFGRDAYLREMRALIGDAEPA